MWPGYVNGCFRSLKHWLAESAGESSEAHDYAKTRAIGQSPRQKFIVGGGIFAEQLFGFVVWNARCIRAGALTSQKSPLVDFIDLHELAPVQ